MGGSRGRVAPWIGAVLLGSLAAGAPLSGPRAGSAEGFGRWETPLRQCRMSSPGRAERPCRRLRLEQNLEGLLSVRFVGAGQGGLLASEELTFAGMLGEGQRSMACRPDGRCREPLEPVQLLVDTVAWASFNNRGLVDTLPEARLAQGHCRLERLLIRCEAKQDIAAAGANWTAEARIGR
jgi:hypothetical protein